MTIRRIDDPCIAPVHAQHLGPTIVYMHELSAGDVHVKQRIMRAFTTLTQIGIR